MKKKSIFILLCASAALLFSGCWSRKEPKQLSMVNSALYDIDDDGNAQLVVEIMDPTPAEGGGQSSGGGGGGPKLSSLTILCKGKTAAEAIRDESKSIDRVLFGGLNKARFFSEKLSKSGIEPLMDYLSRDHLTDERPLVIVVQDEDPKRIYTCSPGLSDMIGDYMESLSHTQHQSTNESVFVTGLEFKKDYYDDGKQPVMGLVKIIDDESLPSDGGAGGATGSGSGGGSQSAQGGSQQGGQSQSAEKKQYLRYEGLAAFKDDKLVGYMNGVEARTYNILTNEFSSSVFSIPSGNVYNAVRVNKAKTKVETSVNASQAEINIKVQAVLSLIQVGNDMIDISQEDGLKVIEQEFDRQLKVEIESTVRKTQLEFQSDIFGFGNYVHIQHPKEWKELKESWDDSFSDAKVNITVESSVVREGEIKNPFALGGEADEQ